MVQTDWDLVHRWNLGPIVKEFGRSAHGVTDEFGHILGGHACLRRPNLLTEVTAPSYDTVAKLPQVDRFSPDRLRGGSNAIKQNPIVVLSRAGLKALCR